MTASIYEQEHEDFRGVVRSFLVKEVVPFHEQWEKDGQVDRAVWTKAGAQGLLCFDVDEEYGGAGAKDFRYNMIVSEEISKVGASGLGFPVHTDIIVPYISNLGRRPSSATGSCPTSSSSSPAPTPTPATRASACSSSSGACRASSAAATWTRWG